MWIITKDYVTTKKEKEEGYRTWVGRTNHGFDKEKFEALPKEKKHTFRLLDDDGYVMLHGVSTNDSSFAPLDAFYGTLGTTEIQYKNEETKEWETL